MDKPLFRCIACGTKQNVQKKQHLLKSLGFHWYSVKRNEQKLKKKKTKNIKKKQTRKKSSKTNKYYSPLFYIDQGFFFHLGVLTLGGSLFELLGPF